MSHRRLVTAVVLLPLLAACHKETPILTPAPAPDKRVALVLNDQGRYEAAPQIGPLALRVEGSIVQATDSNYLVKVAEVVDLRGARNPWMGETVPLQRRHIAMAYERRFHPGRTYALVGVLTAVFVSAALKFKLFGFASGSGDGGPPGQDPNDQ